MSEYEKRDIMALDKAGNFYCRHVNAMTGEKLHSKSDIAAELGFRDMGIASLEAELARRKKQNERLIKGSVKLREAAHTVINAHANWLLSVEAWEANTSTSKIVRLEREHKEALRNLKAALANT